jgi:serine/threonine protein kinase
MFWLPDEVPCTVTTLAFGTTYLAQDVVLHREVAIKEYLPIQLAIREGGASVLPRSTELAQDFLDGRERFLNEARTLAHLDAIQGIVQVLDFLEANGTAYMIMKLVRGETLASMINRKPLANADELMALLVPLLNGLEKVHRAGFLHRDIKPANIIIDPAGHPTLIDFGASRAGFAGHSVASTAIFTPGFAAPEQFAAAKQGPWTDVYGLSATLYNAIVGQKPPSAFDRTLEDTYQPLSEIAPKAFSRALASGIDAGLRLKAADRPQSIDAWRKLLLPTGPASLDSDTVIVRRAAPKPPPPVSSEVPAQKSTSARNRRAALYAGASAAVIVLGAGAYLLDVPNLLFSPPLEAMKVEDLERALKERKAEEGAKAKAAAEAKAKAETEARQKAAEAAAKAKAAAEAKAKADAEARQKAAEADAKARADADARAKADAEARQKAAEADAKARADAEARAKAEAEAKQKAAEAAAKARADAEARAKAEAEAKQKAAEAAAKARADADARAKAEAEAKQKAAEAAAKARADADARAKAEAEAKQKAAEAAAKARADAEAKAKAEAEAEQRAAEADAKARADAEARAKAEAEAEQKAAEANAKAKADAEARAKAEAGDRQKAAEAEVGAFSVENPENVKAAQRELRRLGCYFGGIDGTWGPQTNNALKAAAEKLGRDTDMQPLTAAGLRILHEYKGLLCKPAPRPTPSTQAPPSIAGGTPPLPAPEIVQPSPPAAAPVPPASPPPAVQKPRTKSIHISNF